MRFLSVKIQMWQAQKKGFERRKRRKEELSEDSYLGHAVKNCMTVIESMGRYQVREECKLAPVWPAFFVSQDGALCEAGKEQVMRNMRCAFYRKEG